jgi:phosphoglycolate phosphatase
VIVLFDLDGTLVDSLPGIRRGINETLGLQLTDDEVRPLVGPPSHDTFATLTGASGPELDALVAGYRARYAQIMVEGSVPYPGIRELLADLAAEGATLAVATSKSRHLARDLLEQLGLAERFAAIQGPGMGGDGIRDTKSQTIAAALADLGVSGSRAITMAGDRSHDMEGAHAHGLRAVGVLWGFGSQDELTAAGADALAPDVPALRALLLPGSA